MNGAPYLHVFLWLMIVQWHWYSNKHTHTNKQYKSLLQWPHRPTQPHALSGMENEYQTKCSDALRLESKDRYGSFHLWINVWVAGKTAWFLVNMCHTWAP